MWGKKIPTFGEPAHATHEQGNRERKTEREKYKSADSGSLCLVVQPWGGKFWLWRYRFDGTEKNMTFGACPHVGLKGARERHFAAKKLLATDVNPRAERQEEAEAKHEEVKNYP